MFCINVLLPWCKRILNRLDLKYTHCLFLNFSLAHRLHRRRAARPTYGAWRCNAPWCPPGINQLLHWSFDKCSLIFFSMRSSHHHLPACAPPSTCSISPEVNVASVRNRAASTTSLTSPILPTGCNPLRKS